MTRVIALFILLSALALCVSAQQAPRLYSQYDGTYLGTLSSNPVDPNSTSNPVGIYGSPVSPYSINNPVGIYGSPVSPYSARNPLATQAPIIVAPPAFPSMRPTMPTMPTMPRMPLTRVPGYPLY